MPTQIPQKLLNELMKQESGEVLLTLLTLNHPSFAEPVRIVNDTSDIVSRGILFKAFPFKVVLAPDDGQSKREINIVLDNVSLELIGFFRSVTDRIPANVELIMASLPDEVQMGFDDLAVTNINYNSETISAVLGMDDFLNTEVPSESYTPSLYPGLF